ncbi:MAG TPA: hypothetical protein V6D11_32885 [Waterburya sp.]|jgi:hypothetical protein
MQKLSETVYSTLFWLISSLLVWLVIVPVACIGFPIVMILKAVGQILFQTPKSNVLAAQRKSQTNWESQASKPVEPLVSSWLVKILIEVPAFLAAVISLQPTRVMNKDPLLTQTFQSQSATTRTESSTNTLEVTAEEKTSGT